MMWRPFAVAAGSVIGREHRLAGKNTQDAYCWQATEDAYIAVVCDGCSSGRHSEVGAQLGARLLVRSIAQQVQQSARLCWPSVQADVLRQLRLLAESLGPSLEATVQDCLLFTVLGAVMTPSDTTLFALGDGFFALNGTVHRLGPFPDNAPPYLGYALLQRPASRPRPAACRCTTRCPQRWYNRCSLAPTVWRHGCTWRTRHCLAKTVWSAL